MLIHNLSVLKSRCSKLPENLSNKFPKYEPLKRKIQKILGGIPVWEFFLYLAMLPSFPEIWIAEEANVVFCLWKFLKIQTGFLVEWKASLFYCFLSYVSCTLFAYKNFLFLFRI